MLITCLATAGKKKDGKESATAETVPQDSEIAPTEPDVAPDIILEKAETENNTQ